MRTLRSSQAGLKTRLYMLVALAALVVWLVPLQAAVRPPKLQYQRLVLPNGLVVILHQDKSTPIVHVELQYHVGSKNEKSGRTGFAHFFEHMMFKGSKNVEPEQHTSIIASVGGQANAYTNEDQTVFWQTLPAQYLPLALWLVASAATCGLGGRPSMALALTVGMLTLVPAYFQTLVIGLALLTAAASNHLVSRKEAAS